MTFDLDITEAPQWVFEIEVISVDSEITDSVIDLSIEPSQTILELVPTTTTLEISDIGLQGIPGPKGDDGNTEQLNVAGVAGQTLSGHRLVTYQPDGRLVYASPDNPNHFTQSVWLTKNSAVEDDIMSLVAMGEVTEPSWSWTSGNSLYLGLNGVLTETPPNGVSVFVRIVGNAITSQSIYFDPSPPILFSS